MKRGSGTGIGIAFLDTGLSPMADLTLPKNRIVAFKDFINNRNKPYDDNGHGTHVTGISCGNGYLSKNKYVGIAKNSHIIAVKILDKTGQGTSSIAINALYWVLSNSKRYNIRVVNLSIGSNDARVNTPLQGMVEELWNKGIVVIGAAPNPDGNLDFTPNPPLSPKIITVGAYEDKDYFTEYENSLVKSENNNKQIYHKNNNKNNNKNCSSCSSKYNGNYEYLYNNTNIITNNSPTIYAHGENIVSLLSPNYSFSLPNRSRNNIVQSNYISMSGASMATPLVSGIVSIMLEKHPYLHPRQIKEILIEIAKGNNNCIDYKYCIENYERWF